MKYDSIPANAEHHLVSDFLVEQPSKPSTLVKGLMVRQDPLFACPQCGALQSEPEHGHEGHCKKCDLKWISFGNGLDLWK